LQRIAKILKSLKREEVQILLALEDLDQRFEYIPVSETAKKSGLESDEVLFHLGNLHKMKLVLRSSEPYLGYRITIAGYDSLALYELADKDVILSLGQPYGVGKESNVYRALDAGNQEVAVKFLRWGRTSFRQAWRLRLVDHDSIRTWMDYSKRAANREYKALEKLNSIKLPVPKSIGLNRHVIVMSKMDGMLLQRIGELESPTQVLESILTAVKRTFQEAQMIHGDLSEYNIFVDDNENVTLFDWPQWQPISHPNALWLLRRDISIVLNFFKRRFRIKNDLELILEEIKRGAAEEFK
jgi:RIO kinase 2